MASEIKAPQFPESIADGSVATWYKQPGEAFTRDEPLVDIETDKVVLEILATEDGVLLEIIKNEGDTVLDQEVIGLFEAGAQASVEPAKADTVSTSKVDSGDESRVSPAARKMIDEAGLDAASVSGSGKGGLITKEDVVSHLKNAPAPAAAASKASSKPAAKVADNSVKGLTQMDVPEGARPEKRVR